MLAKRIIPCLDVKDGRVVKGINFVNLRDAGDPVEQAQIYDREGADELVFLDITASHEGRGLMLDIARRVAESVYIPFTVGGGIRTLADMHAIISTGADKISLNTAAVRTPQVITEGAKAFGSNAIVVATVSNAPCRRSSPSSQIRTRSARCMAVGGRCSGSRAMASSTRLQRGSGTAPRSSARRERGGPASTASQAERPGPG